MENPIFYLFVIGFVVMTGCRSSKSRSLAGEEVFSNRPNTLTARSEGPPERNHLRALPDNLYILASQENNQARLSTPEAMVASGLVSLEHAERVGLRLNKGRNFAKVRQKTITELKAGLRKPEQGVLLRYPSRKGPDTGELIQDWSENLGNRTVETYELNPKNVFISDSLDGDDVKNLRVSKINRIENLPFASVRDDGSKSMMVLMESSQVSSFRKTIAEKYPELEAPRIIFGSGSEVLAQRSHVVLWVRREVPPSLP